MYIMSLGLKDQLPCDVHMLNLRSIFNSGHREAALLLHRKGFDCGFSTRPLTCRLTNGQVGNHCTHACIHTGAHCHTYINTYAHTHTCIHKCMRTHTHMRAHMHVHTETQAYTHEHIRTHAQEGRIHYNITLQVAVKEIFNSSPSSSVRTTLTMMYPVEDSTDHIDPMEITTNRLSWD